jgi:iron(III) transport system ATP-binding protein
LAALALERITKSYGDVVVLRGIDHLIPDGTFFTLLGPSGCGKTTLLRIIAGFVEPTAGRVRFGSEDITKLPPHKRHVGMVFQDYALFPHMSAFDNVAYGLRAQGLPRQAITAKVEEYLERVGLGGLGDRLPVELSGGQMQRVALARALVVGPRVLLMDEPLSNLDARLRIQMRDVIRNLQHEIRTTTVFVTHDQEEALVMSDQVAVMREGVIEQCASPLEVYRKPATAYVADFVGAANLLPARWVPGGGEGTAVLDVLGHRIAIPAARRCGPASGLLVLRPENIRMESAEAATSGNTLAGRVQSVRFHGDRTAYVVRIGDTADVTVSVGGAANRRFYEVGDGVRLVVDDELWFVPGDRR